MKLTERKTFACGCQEVKEVETFYYPELKIVKIDGKDGYDVRDNRRCRSCHRAARDATPAPVSPEWAIKAASSLIKG